MNHKSHRGHFEAPREKKRRRGAAKLILLVLLVLVILSGAVYGGYRLLVRPPEKPQELPAATTQTDEPEVTLPTVTQTVTKVDEDTGEEIQEQLELPASQREGVYNILICGTDDDGYRTDTIIVAHLDVSLHEVALMSVPRDTVVLSNSGGIMKINAVYAGGGADGMVRLQKRLGNMLGFALDGYVLVDLNAFCETVDLVGGVEFDVPQDMYYSDPTQNLFIDLKAGRQTLNGEQAMGLVRYRKGYASQDIQRTKVQQEFLRALAKQCLSVSSLTKIKEFADIFSTYVTTDLSVGNMLYFAQALMQCDFDAMKTYTLEGEGAMINGVSYYPLYAGKLVSVVNEAFNPYDAPVTLDTVNVITPDVARTYQIKTEPEEPEESEAPDESEESENPEESSGEEDPAPETDELPPEEFPETGVILPEADTPDESAPEEETTDGWPFTEEFWPE